MCIHNKQKKQIMKKVLAILSLMALTSCGGENTTEESVVVDSVVVSDSLPVVDSTAVVVDSSLEVGGGLKQDGSEIK